MFPKSSAQRQCNVRINNRACGKSASIRLAKQIMFQKPVNIEVSFDTSNIYGIINKWKDSKVLLPPVFGACENTGRRKF